MIWAMEIWAEATLCVVMEFITVEELSTKLGKSALAMDYDFGHHNPIYPTCIEVLKI